MKGVKLYNKAVSLAQGKNPNLKEVFNLLMQSFDLGNYKAAYALATWYLFGKLVNRDYKKACYYLSFAIKGNLPEAYYDLAVCYEGGKGVKKNTHQAFLYYLKAALLGDNEAKSEVCRCYYYGIGINKDLEVYSIWAESK